MAGWVPNLLTTLVCAGLPFPHLPSCKTLLLLPLPATCLYSIWFNMPTFTLLLLRCLYTHSNTCVTLLVWFFTFCLLAFTFGDLILFTFGCCCCYVYPFALLYLGLDRNRQFTGTGLLYCVRYLFVAFVVGWVTFILFVVVVTFIALPPYLTHCIAVIAIAFVFYLAQLVSDGPGLLPHCLPVPVHLVAIHLWDFLLQAVRYFGSIYSTCLPFGSPVPRLYCRLYGITPLPAVSTVRTHHTHTFTTTYHTITFLPDIPVLLYYITYTTLRYAVLRCYLIDLHSDDGKIPPTVTWKTTGYAVR